MSVMCTERRGRVSRMGDPGFSMCRSPSSLSSNPSGRARFIGRRPAALPRRQILRSGAQCYGRRYPFVAVVAPVLRFRSKGGNAELEISSRIRWPGGNQLLVASRSIERPPAAPTSLSGRSLRGIERGISRPRRQSHGRPDGTDVRPEVWPQIGVSARRRYGKYSLDDPVTSSLFEYSEVKQERLDAVRLPDSTLGRRWFS